MTAALLAEIDVSARDLAQAALSGEMNEVDVRANLASMVLTSRINWAVARSIFGLSAQQRADLAENLLDQLVNRVLDVESSFDLSRVAAGGSLCGWARNLGEEMAKVDRAVRLRGMARRVHLVNPLDPPPERPEVQTIDDYARVRFHSGMAFDGLSSEDQALADWTDEEELAWAIDRATALTGFARESMRDRATAAAVREVLHLPSLCVPMSTSERDAILELVTADETLAHRSLVQMAAMVCPEPPSRPLPGEAPVGELLLSLWDDYTADDLESLMVRPARAAHAIVIDALTPLPKPSREAVRALTRATRRASQAKDWVGAQDGLVVAFLATRTEAVSKFDDTNDAAAKAAKEAAARDAAARWPALAARAAGFPGAPLGATVEQVDARLREMLEEARAQDAEARISTRQRRGLAGLADAA